MAFETSRISTTTSLGFMSVKATNGTNTVTASGTGTTHTTGSLSCAAGDTIWVTAYYVDEAGTYNEEPWVSAFNVATTITHGGYLQIVGSGAISPVTGNTVAVAASSNVSSSSTSIGFQRFFTSGEILQRGFSFTAASGHTQAQFRFRDNNSTSYEHLITVPISIGAAVTAPTISSITNNNASSANVTTTVNLSANGSGGTLKYAQSTSNSVPSSGWQTGNTFTHPRNSTRYYWASQSENTAGSYSSSVSHAVGYISPGLTVYVNNGTISSGASSASVSIGSTTAGQVYAVRTVNGSTALGSATASSTTTSVSWSSSLPSAGNSTTYEIYVQRPTSIGGNGAWYDTNDQFSVTRASSSISCPATNSNITTSKTFTSGSSTSSTQSISVNSGKLLTFTVTMPYNYTAGLPNAGSPTYRSTVSTTLTGGSRTISYSGNTATIVYTPPSVSSNTSETITIYHYEAVKTQPESFYQYEVIYTDSHTVSTSVCFFSQSAPATPTATQPITESTNTNIAVNTSNPGSGGDLQLYYSTTAGVPAVGNSGWVTDNTAPYTVTFTNVPRNIPLYLYAQVVSGSTRALSSVGNFTTSTIAPSTAGDVTSPSYSISSGDTTHIISLSGFKTNHEYQIETSGGTVKSAWSAGSNYASSKTVSGAAGDYVVKGRRTIAGGGDGTTVTNIDTYSVIVPFSTTDFTSTAVIAAGGSVALEWTTDGTDAPNVLGDTYPTYTYSVSNGSTVVASGTYSNGTDILLTKDHSVNVTAPSSGSVTYTLTVSVAYTNSSGSAESFTASNVSDTTIVISPPTALSVSPDDVNQAAASIAVTLSATDTGTGSLEYAQSTSNSIPVSAGDWTASSTSFTNPRGSTRYYWVRMVSGSVVAPRTTATPLTVGYLDPQTTGITVSPTSQTIEHDEGSASVTVSDVSRATDAVAVRLNNGSTALDSRTGNGTLSFTSSLPAYEATNTYELFTRRPIATGGNESTWYQTNITFTVSRSIDTTVTQFSLGANVTGAARNAVTTRSFVVGGVTPTYNITFTATGAAEVSTDNTNWSTSITRQNGQTVYFRGTASSSFSTPLTATVTATYGGSNSVTDSFIITTAGSVNPDVNITPIADLSRPYLSSDFPITIAGATATTIYEVRTGSYSGTVVATANTSAPNGTLTVNDIPAAGASKTYYITGRVTSANNGTNIPAQIQTFIVTRQAADGSPNAFNFTDVASSVLNSVKDTYVQIVDIEIAVAVTRTGSGTFSISSTTTPGSFGTTGNISNNQYLHVRQTTSSSYNDPVSTVYTVGGISDTWTVTSVAEIAPDTTITDVGTITRPNGSTDHTITIAAGSSDTIYEVRTVSASGDVVGTGTGNGDITTTGGVGVAIPSAGTSATYYITGRVTTTNGGTNTSALADTYIVLHEAAGSGSTTGDGGTGTYGIRVFDASGNTTLDVSDRVVTFRERVQGSLTASQTSKTVTLSGVGTAVINLTPITTIFVGNVPQRQQILYFTISGTSLTIQRTATNAAGSANAVQAYDLLVVYDPE